MLSRTAAILQNEGIILNFFYYLAVYVNDLISISKTIMIKDQEEKETIIIIIYIKLMRMYMFKVVSSNKKNSFAKTK